MRIELTGSFLKNGEPAVTLKQPAVADAVLVKGKDFRVTESAPDKLTMTVTTPSDLKDGATLEIRVGGSNSVTFKPRKKP